MKYYFYILIFVLPLIANNDIDTNLQKNRSQLQKVRNQINSLKNEITKTDIKASSAFEQVKHIEKELGLISQLTTLLEHESKLLNQKINKTRNDLILQKNILTSLKSQHAKRLVHTYKYGKIKNLELLLNAQSLNQAIVRYQYLKYFSEQEKKQANKISLKIEEINFLQESLDTDLQALNKSIREKENEKQKYLAKKDEKNILIRKLKWTSNNLNAQLKAAEEEYQKLYQIILTLERERKLREQKGDTAENYALNLKNFNNAKGKLPWPVNGKVIHKYGKQRHRILKTYIKNNGIDIKATAGVKVHAVFPGIVSMITYLSGFGNTVILDHGKGYYTVYSHLESILVNKDDFLEGGNVIGYVGDSGSLEGSKLHFEIYANQNTVNPLIWLK